MKPIPDPVITGIIDSLASVKESQAEIFTYLAKHLPGISLEEREDLKQSAMASVDHSQDLRRLLPGS